MATRNPRPISFQAKRHTKLAHRDRTQGRRTKVRMTAKTVRLYAAYARDQNIDFADAVERVVHTFGKNVLAMQYDPEARMQANEEAMKRGMELAEYMRRKLAGEV